jgi:hypothetical protein
MENQLLNLSQVVSQDDIYNFFGGIDFEKILKRKTFPSWAFTNENLNELGQLTFFKNKEIFSILGGGDQPIYFILKGAKEVISCDNRDLACLFSEFKISCFKNLSFKEFREIFLDEKKENSKIYFEKIRPDLSFSAKKIFDYLFEGLPKNILSTLKKSKFFYKESWYFLKRKGWLPFFEDSKSFLKIKKGVNKIFILNSDFTQALKKLNKKFDLIYTSNIFEGKKYSPDVEKTLIQIDLHLKENGEILIVDQNRPKKIISFLEKIGYNFRIKEPKRKFLPILFRTYPYYYLLAKK